ncbi:MAG: hypothetical protein WD825_06425 [Gemmatimonadaceae bacterium]
MPRRPAFFTALAFAVAACSGRDSRAAADSAELARDLALANQTPVYSQFRDSAIADAPETRTPNKAPTPTSTKRPAAPARRTTPVVVEERPHPAAPVETPVEQPAPAARTRGFNAGTSFGLTTKSPICTTNLPGDKIVATLTEPVQGENGAYMPAGTTVVLEVASVTPGDRPESAQISLRVRSIDLNEQLLPVQGDVAILSELERRERPRDKGSDRRKVVGGAVAGAVLGQIMGRDTKSTVIGAAAGAAAGTAAAVASREYDACLPAGSTVRVTTSQQITLGV